MKKTLFPRSFLFVVVVLFSACSSKTPQVLVPNRVQQQWADAEIGVLIHFDMPVFDDTYNFRHWGTHPDASAFNPSDLNTDQWLQTASSLGAKYAVLVAKHCSGFSLWPTEAHDYSVKNCPWMEGKGDIVADFVASCRKYGIRPGIYASTTANGYLYVDNPGYIQTGAPVTQEEYNAIVVKQLTELWSNYGELFEIWFDGGVLSPHEGGADVQRIEAFGKAIQERYGTPATAMMGRGDVLTLTLDEPLTIDRLVLQEDIARGERVLRWHVDGKTASGQQVRLCEGTNIGHKRIATFSPVEVKACRFVVDEAKARPHLRQFAVYEK